MDAIENPQQLHEKAVSKYEKTRVFSPDVIKLWEDAQRLLAARKWCKSGDVELNVKICHNLSLCYQRNLDFDKAEEYNSTAFQGSDQLGMKDVYLKSINTMCELLKERDFEVNRHRILYLRSLAAEFAMNWRDDPEIEANTRFYAWLNLANIIGTERWRDGYDRPMLLFETFQNAKAFAEIPKHHADWFYAYGKYHLMRETALGLESGESEDLFRNHILICKEFDLPLDPFLVEHGLTDESKEWQYPPDIPQWRYE